MIHPDTELRLVNPQVGYGVFATKFIPEGTIVYAKDSLELEISPLKFNRLPKNIQDQVEKYSYIDERGNRIVSWDIGKYVNHCCNCNTISTGYGFEIAIRDIQPGEEITDEYGIFNLEEPIELVCNKGMCRKTVKPEDFDQYYPEWDKKIKKSLSKYKDVEQPLFNLLDKKTQKGLEEYVKNPDNYKSVYNLKYVPQKSFEAVNVPFADNSFHVNGSKLKVRH